MSDGLDPPGRVGAWRAPTRLHRANVSSHYLPWLLDASSLTRRLCAACPSGFRVQILSQGWARPLAEERRRLGVRQGQRALVREVLLLCHEQAWVFARSVIPRATLTGRGRRLAHLGTRPLGAVLFADPTMERDPVEIARLTPGHALFVLAAAGLQPAPAEIWGRRSVFRLAARPLLVSEIFLPGIPETPSG